MNRGAVGKRFVFIIVNGSGRGAASQGAEGFIVKPYHLKKLTATVRRVLDERE